MNQQVEMIECAKCGKVREKFLVGCPKCGTIENREIRPDSLDYYEITFKTIEMGKMFYKKELTDEQRTFFSERIPTGQSWQFYAGVVLSNNLNVVWLEDLVRNNVITRDAYDQPICCGNSRAFFVISFMSKEKQENFCNMLNAFSHQRIRHDKQKNKRDVQGEAGGVIQDTSTGELPETLD